ncbi:MAG: energy-coupling factor transporter transmembrane protein EcfT, partial [Clostridia bacterium]|nr:energy-coupling factor transporter transmembrane protein EcfT [Clostridia bacterium]
CWLLPAAVLAMTVNTAFSHAGITILAYLPSGNPLTLESIIGGAQTGLLLITVLVWFSCFHKVMTADKWICLFGRIIPALSLLFSMTLRFIPKLSDQYRMAAEAQRALGMGIEEGGFVRRMKNSAAVLSIMLTWSLENAVETADSMKSRGYGLPGRTAYTVYRLDRRGKELLCLIAALTGFVLSGMLAGGLSFRIYPTIRAAELSPLHIALQIAVFVHVLIPVILDILQDRAMNEAQRKTTIGEGGENP